MAVNDDYRYHAELMDDTISILKQRKEEMDALCEQIKVIVNNKLLGEGIAGATAEVLAETFLEEVIKPTIGYFEESEKYIKKNEEVKEQLEEASQRTQNIASM